VKGCCWKVGDDGAGQVRAQYKAEAGPGPVPAGFAGVYERFFADIHHYIAGRLGRDVADDIAADTFVIALRKYDSFDAGRGPVRAWLFGIATNLVAQHRRAEQRRYRALGRAGAGKLADGPEACVLSRVAAEGMRPQLAATLARLPS
jgi:DNA-directed RNA polymerase specialized sigma24 family protein